jgi:hypothetical protein
METTPAAPPLHVPDPQLQLTPEELALLLETTTPDEAEFPESPCSPHTSGDDNNDGSTDATATAAARLLDPKRVRRSEIEKLSRRRRQATLREMRDDVEQLERQMRAMLQAARDTDNPSVPTKELTADTAQRLEALRQEFVQLSIDAERLENEKQSLRRMLRSRQLLAQSVRSLSAAFTDDWDELSWRDVLEQRTYEPLPRDELFRIMRNSFEAINAYDTRTDILSSGKAFMGWVDRHHVDADKELFFSFTKRFPGRDPEQVMLASWDIFSQEERLRRSMAPNSVDVRLRVLQEPNDDVVVLHRQTRSQHFDKSFHTVYLLFRLRTDDGFTICFRTIPALGIQDALEDMDVWVDLFHWYVVCSFPL